MTQEVMFDNSMNIQHWSIDKLAIEQINQVIYKYGYFAPKQNSEITSFRTDYPYCITLIELQNGIKRKIGHYLGKNLYPKRLTTLENSIDKKIEVGRYLIKEPNFL